MQRCTDLSHPDVTSLFSHNGTPERMSKIDLLTSSTSVRQQAVIMQLVENGGFFN
jgi:hypothetical protein